MTTINWAIIEKIESGKKSEIIKWRDGSRGRITEKDARIMMLTKRSLKGELQEYFDEMVFESYDKFNAMMVMLERHFKISLEVSF